MRKTSLLSAVIISVLVSCNQQELKNLKYSNHFLKSENSELSSQIESYLSIFNEIENNLADIKERENLIDLKTGGDLSVEEDVKESIIEDIQMINALMAENQNKIQELSNSLAETNAEFKQMVNRLNKRIKERDNAIAELKVKLENSSRENRLLAEQITTLNQDIDTLKTINERQELVIQTTTGIIEEKDELLNAAFVTIGSHKDLKNKAVIEDEGGILGIGSTQQLKNDFNTKAFSKVDIRTTEIIPIDARKLKLVTNHPKESYELFINEEKGNIEALQILNPEVFWNSSRYLVVMTN